MRTIVATAIGGYAITGETNGNLYSAATWGVNSGDGAGVRGFAAGTGFAGVSGEGPHNGVWGRTSSVTDSGVYGENIGAGYGVAGSTNSDFPVAAMWGANFGGGVAVRGTSFGSGLAGYFEGSVYITGDLNVDGAKNAVVKTASFGKRQLYAVESPENWFEDFGRAKLVHGRVVIQIEPMFAETVNTESEYHVFLTPRGDCKGLYIANQGPASFEVRELHKGKANITFDYRIVAKRRAYERLRLAESKDTGNTKQLGARLTGGPPPLPPTAAAIWSAAAGPSSSQPGSTGSTRQPLKCSGTN